jgi:hypothetical protein
LLGGSSITETAPSLRHHGENGTSAANEMRLITLFPNKAPNSVSAILRFSGLAIIAVPMALSVPVFGGQALAAVAVIDRPVFDRKTATIDVPFKGGVPNYTVQYLNNATRVNVDFVGCEPKVSTAYKLAVYHELLSQVELMPVDNKVRVSILTSKGAKVSVDADLRHGVMRLTLEEVDLMEAAKLDAGTTGTAPVAPSTPTPAPFTVANGPPPPVPAGAGRNVAPAVPARQGPAQPKATPGPLPPTGLDPLVPSPPPITPNVMPSMPPIHRDGQAPGSPMDGTPASGTYVYRKAIPTGTQDVTEVQVRTGSKAEVDVAHDPRSQSVVVNVVRPEAPPEPVSQAMWSSRDAVAGADEAWKLPSLRRDLTFRPLPAVDAVVGYALMLSESAPKLGSDFTGGGATSWAFDGHVPLGTSMNLNLGVQGLGYNITSSQVKDDAGAPANTHRDEYLGQAQLEYLAVRSPWVFAIGPGYWARYMMNKPGTLLPPPTPSLILGPNQLFHGPALNMRVYYPLWDAWGINAEVGGAPYMMGGGDSVGSSLGSLYGYDALLGVKWGNRYVSLSAGYHQQGFGNFSGSYSFSRGGPEASFVWRF